MPSNVRALARPEIAPRKRLRLPPKRYARSAGRAIREPQPRRYARRMRSDKLLDAAIALAVFTITLVLLAAGDDHATYGGEITLLGILLSALGSLPLVYSRRAP